MMRSVTYRHAVNAFLFTALWFAFGAVVLWTPVPGALGIGGEMFAAWVLLFFGALAVSGVLLTIAALNGAFPRRPASARTQRAQARRPGDAVWAPRADASHAAGGRREG